MWPDFFGGGYNRNTCGGVHLAPYTECIIAPFSFCVCVHLHGCVQECVLANTIYMHRHLEARGWDWVSASIVCHFIL